MIQDNQINKPMQKNGLKGKVMITLRIKVIFPTFC